METHEENIVCPSCDKQQKAIVEHTMPWFSYVHNCECGWIITESEWQKVEDLKSQVADMQELVIYV